MPEVFSKKQNATLLLQKKQKLGEGRNRIIVDGMKPELGTNTVMRTVMIELYNCWTLIETPYYYCFDIYYTIRALHYPNSEGRWRNCDT